MKIAIEKQIGKDNFLLQELRSFWINDDYLLNIDIELPKAFMTTMWTINLISAEKQHRTEQENILNLLKQFYSKTRYRRFQTLAQNIENNQFVCASLKVRD